MTACDDLRMEIGAYVLGGLEPTEEEAVREHLARCHECAAEHARLARLPALLSLADHIEDAPPLSPAVEERVLDAVAREQAPPVQRRWRSWAGRRRWLLGAAAVATAACAVVLAVVVLGGGGRYEIALQPVAGQSGGGRAQFASEKSGTTVRLWVRDLPPDPGIVYEVRCDAPGWSASAGTFRADSRGRAYVVLTTAMRRGEYDGIRVVRRTRSASTDVLAATLH
jgi:hypothetical protein